MQQTRLLSFSPSRERGSAIVMLLLLITAVVAIAAFGSDSTRLTADAAQLKRATDAAAMAAAHAYAVDEDADIQAIAEKYVNVNLGMDSAQTGNQLRISATSVTFDGDPGVRVAATFTVQSLLNGAGPTDTTVTSTAVAVQKSLEVALALPNTLSETSANLAVLRRLGKSFAKNLIEGRDNTWLSLVPYSQSVSVYDASQPDRISTWAASGALRPVELTSLFNSGYSGLRDARMPDRRAKVLCMFRGLNRGENYFWETAPTGQFGIYYRADIPSNDSNYGINPYTITWVGPNPSFGQATGVNDTRTLITDRGCPSAALLPLSSDLDDIDTRLDDMSSRFNTNYAIAMGWSAMALAPSFRGNAGWGLTDDLPKDFDQNGSRRLKAIVFLVNSSDQLWFDTDAYNRYVGESTDGCTAYAETGTGCSNQDALVTERFTNLCNSFRARNLTFYLIVTGKDEIEGVNEDAQVASASDFRRIAGPGLAVCTESKHQLYLSGEDFVASEGEIQSQLEKIVKELKQESSFVRLVD